MKKHINLILFLVLYTSTLIAQEKEQWVKIKDTIAAYTIEFPSIAKEEIQEVPTLKGKVKMNSYSLSPLDGKNLIYMTSYTEYPSSFFENGLDTYEKQNEVLNGSVNGAVNNTKGSLLSDKKFVFNGYNGRDFRIQLDTNIDEKVYIIHIRTILVEFKLYLAQVIYEVSDGYNLDAKRFFESFELIKVKK